MKKTLVYFYLIFNSIAIFSMDCLREEKNENPQLLAAAQGGVAEAQFTLACTLEQSRPHEAYSLLQKAADQGHVGALLMLARKQIEKKNITSALDCYKKAAEQGEISAFYRRGELLERQGAVEAALSCYKDALK